MAYFKHLRLEKQWKHHWILHQQYHEEKLWLEATDPSQDHNDNQRS